MAIDTQTKRRSVSGYSGLIVAPIANGAIDATDREHIAGLYAGLGSVAPPGTTYPIEEYRYAAVGPTSAIAGGTTRAPEVIYD